MYLHEFNMDTIQFCLPKILIQKMSALLYGRKIQLVFSALFFFFFFFLLHRLCSWQLNAAKVLVQCFLLVLLAHSLGLYFVVHDNAKHLECSRLEQTRRLLLLYSACFSCCCLQIVRA